MDNNFVALKFNTNSKSKTSVLYEYKDEMLIMRNAGRTYREIAEFFGVSKQRIWTIVNSPNEYGQRARKSNYNIEKIVYKGIYNLFANDYKMTITKLAKVTYDTRHATPDQTKKISSLIENKGRAELTIRQIKNICEYVGAPFESVFELR